MAVINFTFTEGGCDSLFTYVHKAVTLMTYVIDYLEAIVLATLPLICLHMLYLEAVCMQENMSKGNFVLGAWRAGMCMQPNGQSPTAR